MTGLAAATPRHLVVAAAAAGESLEGLMVEFETWLRSWSAAATTIHIRMSVLLAVFDVVGDPRNVTATDLTSWLARPGLGDWARLTYYNHMRSFFGWLESTERIRRDPTLGMHRPKQPKDLPRPLTGGEVTQALAAAEGNLRTWLLLGLLAGLRAHEIAKIRAEDVDEQSLYVFGKGAKAAVLPTHPELWEAAQTYPRRGYWFPGISSSPVPHVQSGTVTRAATMLFRKLEIEGSIHRLRHTFATNLIRSGANLRVTQTLMRHESLATTAKYTAVDEDERIRAVHNLRAIT